MNIDTWWKWVLAVLLSGLLIFSGVKIALWVNDGLYDGDRRCAAVKCVIVKE